MGAQEQSVESLSQRELRNESGRVMREVAQGQSFVLTNRGVPVGRLVPIDAAPSGLPRVRPARRTGGWANLAPKPRAGDRAVSEVLDELRGDRA